MTALFLAQASKGVGMDIARLRENARIVRALQGELASVECAQSNLMTAILALTEELAADQDACA